MVCPECGKEIIIYEMIIQERTLLNDEEIMERWCPLCRTTTTEITKKKVSG